MGLAAELSSEGRGTKRLSAAVQTKAPAGVMVNLEWRTRRPLSTSEQKGSVF